MPSEKEKVNHDYARTALSAQDVRVAAEGCSVIVHAVNPPGYRRWPELVLPMLENTIAAALVLGATVLLPGTIYNFGPDAFPILNEDSPQRSLTVRLTGSHMLGRLRSHL
jgi:hypothetical protein